jgi:hypothetical protein
MVGWSTFSIRWAVSRLSRDTRHKPSKISWLQDLYKQTQPGHKGVEPKTITDTNSEPRPQDVSELVQSQFARQSGSPCRSERR